MKSKKSKTLPESPLFWPARLERKALWVLDETLIPKKLKYIKVRNTQEAVKVIREMKTRAFGQFLVVVSTFLLELQRNAKLSNEQLVRKLQQTAQALNSSRPTFPFSEVTGMIMGWAQKAQAEQVPVKSVLEKYLNGYLAGIRGRRLERVANIAKLIQDGDSILTHCNVSGELAMAAAICQKEGKDIHFFATETRPYFQGAKLTAWELNRLGTPVTLIADNAVGSVIADGLVNKVIVGSDRNCANGDFANKIGTYQIAVLAKEFGIPFYVLTQPSTKVAKGEDIPIEIRSEHELLKFGRKRIAPAQVKGFYPGFDVIPYEFVTQTVAINVN